MNNYNRIPDLKIDEVLVEFFFGCNIPFNVVESEFFKHFINTLNSSYQVPSRKKLSTKLLDRIYQNVNKQLGYSKETDGILLMDGWKNSSANTKNVVCIIYTKDKRSIFLNSWDFTELKETDDELAIVIDEAVTLAKERFNVKIYAVVSDNASAMMRMSRLVSVWHTTCHSHSGNLLLKSFVESKLVECINKLLRKFKSSRGERELKKRGGTRIMLACETRWCTYRDTFCCSLKNLNIMRQIVKEGIITIKSENLTLLEDNTLEERLQDYITLFDPVCELVNKCQRAETSLAKGTELWVTLNIPTESDSVDKTLEDRLNKVLQPIALAANYLHPEYRGKEFAHLESSNKTVSKFLHEELANEDPSELVCLREYSEGKGIFVSQDTKSNIHTSSWNTYNPPPRACHPRLRLGRQSCTWGKVICFPRLGHEMYYFEKLFRKKLKSSEAFWSMAEFDYPALSGLAMKLCNISSSTAQIERLFSNWAFIHSDLRNRLSVERSMKLVSVYYALKMRDSSWTEIDDAW